MKKTRLITPFFQKPFLILGYKIKSSLFPQLFPSCALDRKPFSSSACNYHREKSQLFWAIHLRFHTRPVFNTPEWSSSGQPSPLSCTFSMPPALTHAPSIPTLILSMISFLALLEMDHSTQTVLIRWIALPCLGPLGLTNTSMQASSTRI